MNEREEPPITVAEIEHWATSIDLDGRFRRLQEEDPDGFEHEVLAACDDRTLLRLAAMRASAKRRFFAIALIQRIVFFIYGFRDLPYHFSRFQGMKPFDEYRDDELKRIEHVYERCRVVEQMRNSSQDEIKNLGDMVLDFRHDRLLPNTDSTKLLRLLEYQIEMSFRPGVATYTTRPCGTCGDWFKSWVADGMELEERCPFCILGITYPQKAGNNARRCPPAGA